MKLLFLHIATLSFIFALLISPQATAQQNEVIQKQVSFRELTVKQGLSQNSVVSVAQDSTGYMWFATQDGLNKYDGKKFIHYDRQFEDVTRPTFSKLGKIYVDRDSILWIISNSGLLERYDSDTDSFTQAANIGQASVLYQDAKKNYYMGTYGNGLYKIDPIKKDTLQLLNENDRSLNSYAITEWNKIIFVSTSKGLLQLENEKYVFLENDVAESLPFSALTTLDDEILYTGTYGNGLFIKKGLDGILSQFTGFEAKPFPVDLKVQDLLIDYQERLWVATYGNGAYLIDFKIKTIQHFTANKADPYALHYNDVLSLYKDFTETVWLGTDGAGLSFYDKNLVKFNVLTNNQTPPSIDVDVIRAIAVDKNAIWMGTSGKGLTQSSLYNNSFKTFTQENSNLASNRVMSLLKDDDTLFIGHQDHGLQILGKDNIISNCIGTENLTIWKISRRDNNTLWLCTRNQGLLVYKINNGVIKKYDVSNSTLRTNNIRTVVRGENNILWIGTEYDGLYKLDIIEEKISKIEAIPDNIKCLYLDKKQLWVGTNGNGLKLYTIDKQDVHAYSKKEGIPNNVIYGVLPDDQNNLWLSTNQGLTKFSIDKNYKPSIENYSNYDGLQALEYNTGAYHRDENGTLYFGGLEGINWFQPNQLTFNPKKPKTVLTGLQVFNEDRRIIQGQKFPHTQNTLTFHFSSLHYSQPERNLYKYKLINNDPDWIESGNKNTAHYTNLPPNEYTFQVISSNYDGIWNNDPTSYSFTIMKPWYTTAVAKIAYAIGLIFLLYLLYVYLKWRWNIQNQLQLEHEETERLKKLSEFKTKLYTNISHEIRTPLTLISGPVENQLKKEQLSKADEEDLKLIQQNSTRLMRLVDQMLDLSLVDSGEAKLKVARADLSSLLHQIVAAFQYTAENKNNTVSANIEEIKNAWYDQDIVEKVLSNLLSNSVKYAPEDTEIVVSVVQRNNDIELNITNQTYANKNTNPQRLFERFHQDDVTSEGMGVGLALVKELVSLHKGKITVSEEKNTTITFTVTLPINREAFTEAEIVISNMSHKDEKETQQTEYKERQSTVLVVEDNSEIRNYIVSNLNHSYTIITAKNGLIGIELAEKKSPDLIVSDIMMPITNGIELCDTLKKNQLTSHIPIILVTAKVGEENEIKGFRIGADAYITKPFSIEKLRLLIKNLIESRQQLKDHFSKTFELSPELAITDTETSFLNRLQTTLNKHITDPQLTSDRFSQLMTMSRTQLHLKLTSIVGMNTTTFIRSQRLKLACGILKESDANISEIAYEVGFSSSSYFTRCFKEAYGCTPTQYATQHL